MMLINKANIKRLGIYFFYDKDGIVDDYVTYFLSDFVKNISDLIIVCNGTLDESGKAKLLKFTSNVLIRENKGFDVWAYKYGLEYLGWDKIYDYDEVILLNSTIMGPLYSFSEMFNTMDEKDLDFWGITTYHHLDFDPFGKCQFGYIPTHIQSHFIVIRQDMLKSKLFKEYWESRPMINSYEEAICFHEAIFTKLFADKGYKWDVYVNTNDLLKHSYHPIIMSPLELVKNRRCPIFKRRSFFHYYDEFLSLSLGNQSVDLFEYIKNNTSYNVDLIWQNILRTQNQSDIKKCLHLNYILSSKKSNIKPGISNNIKTALIMHCYFEDLVEYCYNYAKSMPTNCDIFITTNTEEKKSKIEKVFCDIQCNNFKVILIENIGRDVSALLVACKKFIMDYDYVCFAHDKKVSQLNLGIKGEAFSYQCFENILKSKEYVENILNEFEDNPRLGLLTPPPPNHADYYPTISFEWGYNYEITKELSEKLELRVNICKEKEPIAPLGTMFWFRPQALKKLFDYDWEYNDFPKEPNNTDGTLLHAIERIYPFVVQHEGYYPAWVMADSFARIEFDNLYHMLSELNEVAFKLYGFNSHYGLVSTMKYALSQGEKEGTPETDKIMRRLLKDKIRNILPESLWNFMKKVYKVFGGKRWLN
ncbi:hypothetical protein SDC9_41312 [bioreactor metagenome]|uniref:Rhamnan synthesis protein F n=1 Tax=bioreactor metagenome TaxID=1076179 RepID=A0A644VUX9_9ZZZZ